MDPDKIKHLEFVQAIITRMNTNSFQIKGWNITILSALLAIYASTKNELFIIISLVPTLSFWLLDSYYLMQERKFRGLYKDITGTTNTQPNLKPYEMRLDLYKKNEYCFFKVLRSPSTVSLYLPLSLLIICSFFYLSNSI